MNRTGSAPVNGNGNGSGAPVGEAAGEQRAGLTRRRPGQHIAPGLVAAQAAAKAAQAVTREQPRDPESERAQLDSLFAGFQRGETSQQPPVPSEPPVERPS